MRRIIAFTLLCLAAQFVSCADLAQNSGMVIAISSDRDVILPCEPLGVAVILKNESGNAIERVGSQWTSFRIKNDEIARSTSWMWMWMPRGVSA
jgi:hypothetical protein